MTSFNDISAEIVTQILKYLHQRSDLFSSIKSSRQINTVFLGYRSQILEHVYSVEILQICRSHDIHDAIIQAKNTLHKALRVRGGSKADESVRLNDAALLANNSWETFRYYYLPPELVPLVVDLVACYNRLNRTAEAFDVLEIIWLTRRAITELPLAQPLAALYTFRWIGRTCHSLEESRDLQSLLQQ